MGLFDFFKSKAPDAPDAASNTNRRGKGDRPYRLGYLTRSSRLHNPMAMSGDTAVFLASDLMARRGREMYTNEPRFKRPIDLVRDLCVGTGIHAFADPVNYSFGAFLNQREDDLLRSFDYALESDEQFLNWAMDPERCDIEGRQNVFQMQAMCITETGQVGDAFIKLIYTRNSRRGEIPLKLQLIEREQLDCTKDRFDTRRGNRIINGIEFDENGYEIGIHVYETHPHDSWQHFSTQSDFIPAKYYLHYYKKTRPSQHIGATFAHAIGSSVVMSNEWKMTELRKAIKQAQHVLVYKTDDDRSMSFELDPDDPEPLRADEISMSFDPIAAQIGKDDELELIDSASPNNAADKFFELLDTDQAMAMNLSPYTYTGRFEKVNQSGFRASLQLEDSQIRPIQNALGQAVVLPIRREFNRLAVATGMIKSITPAEFVSERRRYQRFDCIGPGRILLDAEMETDAAMAKIRGGFSTLKLECAKLGLHYIHVLRQIKLENILCERMGIALDHSKGQGGQVDRNTRSADNADADTNAAFADAVQKARESMAA